MLHMAECVGGSSGGGLSDGGSCGGTVCGRERRLLAAMRTVCRVLDVSALKGEEAADSLRCFCTEAQAGRSWAERAADWCRCGGGFGDSGAVAGPPDDLLHYHSDADGDGVTATQEIEFASSAETDSDACSVCLSDGTGDEEAAAEANDPEQQYNCYIWFLYTRAQSPYKAGLIYSPDTGSWTQFVTAREIGAEAERLVATHSDAFNPGCPHLIGGMRRLLLNLKYLVLRLQR